MKPPVTHLIESWEGAEVEAKCCHAQLDELPEADDVVEDWSLAYHPRCPGK